MADTPEKTVEQKIVDYMEENGIKRSWLATKLDVSATWLHIILKGSGGQKAPLTEEKRKKINEILKTNF